MAVSEDLMLTGRTDYNVDDRFLYLAGAYQKTLEETPANAYGRNKRWTESSGRKKNHRKEIKDPIAG